jgi:pimeloyl-ACP methyl ester carboxylesterase
MKASTAYCAAAMLGIAVFLGAGCTAPISARLTTPKAVFRQLHGNVLNTGDLTPDTRTILRRYDQELVFEETPDEALKLIHAKALASLDRDEIFALAELNYEVAERVRQSLKPWEPRDARDYYLASAVFSYLFLFGEASQPKPDGFDTRFRVACNLYNSALGLAFRERRSTNAVVLLEDGTRPLPIGRLPVTVATNSLPWPMDRFQQMLLADQYEIHGLSVRNRNPGLGVPIIAVGKLTTNSQLAMTAPVSAFLRLEGGVKELGAGNLRGSLELYSGYNATQLKVGDQPVPVAADLTAPMAYAMNQSVVWALGRMQFLSAEEKVPTGVYLTQPYEAGKIPIVFVHGTFSSPVYWMEMANTLRSDDTLSRRYQFWYFIYNTGNPIAYSAKRLRDSLQAKLQEIDPEGKDPALQQMVVIGHSQGGLLTKMTATDTGDTLLRLAVSNRLDKLTAEDRAALESWLVYKPLPFVKRVVFICTPHRGSYQAGGLVVELARRLVSLPSKLNDSMQDLASRAALIQDDQAAEKAEAAQAKAFMPTSVYGMSSKNKFLVPMANIPIAPGIAGHSIIAVKGDGDYHDGDDGVVKYSSAHVEYVESELVVHSGHSCQSLPVTIGEVRRILYEHLGSIPEAARARAQSQGVK